MRRRDDEFTRSPSESPSGTPSGQSSNPPSPPHQPQPPNAFDRAFLETFSRREPAPATPEADHAGPWRVLRTYGADDPRWSCYAAGECPPLPGRYRFREPDLAHLTCSGLSLVDRPPRFRYQVDAAGTLHLMHDGYPVGQVRKGAPQSDQLPLILTALANLRVQPEALAQFLLAVPDEVLRRCGVILGEMMRAG
jgi:hypothetical protein